MKIECNGNEFFLENNFFKRAMRVDKNGLSPISFFNKMSNKEYLYRQDSAEFSFIIDEKFLNSFSIDEVHELDGNTYNNFSKFVLKKYNIYKDSETSQSLELIFDMVELKIELSVIYTIYSDLAACRKYLKIKNYGEKIIKLSALSVEMLNVNPGELKDVDKLKDNGRTICPVSCVITSTDDMLKVHNNRTDEGIIFGLEIPIPQCFFEAYPSWPRGIMCGYSRSSAAFFKYIAPNETFTSGAVLSMVYFDKKNSSKVSNNFSDLIRRQLPQLPKNNGVMYCTWIPFLKNINENLVLELAEKAKKMNFDTLVIDDGYFTQDNWSVDKNKFPNGLKYISEKIKEYGLKFGLWINFGNDYGAPGSRPEDNAILIDNSFKKFGYESDLNCRCLASKQREFCIQQLTNLVEEYAVDYFKVDFSHIVSPYGIMVAGCASTKHEHHHNQLDSIYEQYQSMFYIRNEVKRKYPELLIDYSFECFGTERPGISVLQSSEIHHASNLNTNKPIFSSRLIRKELYHYSELLPQERILGSLICLQDKDDEENLCTALVTSPLVAGDLRKISEQTATNIAQICSTFNRLNNNNKLTNFDLLNGHICDLKDWDGYARYDKDGHGFMAIFANESNLKEFTIKLSLPPNDYTFKNIIKQKIIATYSSEEIAKGVKIKFDKYIILEF